MSKPIWLGLFLLLAASTETAAWADEAAIKAQQVKFVKAYVSAMQSKDAKAAMRLLYPTLRTCAAGRARPFFDNLLAQQMEGFPSGHYVDLRLTPVTPKKKPFVWAFVPEKSFPYPVMPAYDANVVFDAAPGLFNDLLEIAPSGGAWYWVAPCPNADGVRYMAMLQAKGDAQRAKARELAAHVREPLLSKMRTLIAAQDRFGAAEAYQKATGSDFATAMSVVDALQNPKS